MRGFAVPQRPDDYWECARIVMNNSSASTFLEWLLLGPDRNIQLHLLIPTQFGILLNKRRGERIVSIVKEHADKASILIRQQDCMTRCAKCDAPLEQHEDKPFQMVLRLATGQALDDVWSYDFLLCFFCADCQTVKTCTLFKTSDLIYAPLSACIAKYGFADAFRPPRSRNDLMDAYLERFILLNQHTPNILKEALHVDQYCYHCGKQVKRLKACPQCSLVYFCTRGDCLEKATANHHQQHLCIALRERHLFHIEDALYINDQEVLPCKRYAKIC
jgi:hypothetical protein